MVSVFTSGYVNTDTILHFFSVPLKHKWPAFSLASSILSAGYLIRQSSEVPVLIQNKIKTLLAVFFYGWPLMKNSVEETEFCYLHIST